MSDREQEMRDWLDSANLAGARGVQAAASGMPAVATEAFENAATFARRASDLKHAERSAPNGGVSVVEIKERWPVPNEFDVQCTTCGASVLADERPVYLSAEDALEAAGEAGPCQCGGSTSGTKRGAA